MPVHAATPAAMVPSQSVQRAATCKSRDPVRRASASQKSDTGRSAIGKWTTIMWRFGTSRSPSKSAMRGDVRPRARRCQSRRLDALPRAPLVSAAMASMLGGVRVVEVADWGFVPSAGTALSDWGAEVVKVEHPRHGDPIRGLITGGVIPGASGRNFIVEQIGRNKRSVGIDLATEDGRALLCRLVERADVFLTNFLPDARERLRLTYEDLRRVNPRLIYAKGHGQGARGPDARRGGYDGVSFWARGGIADRLSTPGQSYVQQRPAFGDFIGGMCIAGGVAAALYRRERTGEGIELDVSLLGTAMWVLSPDITAALMYGQMLPTAGEMKLVPNPLVGNYVCQDGKVLVLMMLQSERFWPHFAETVGRHDLLERYPTPEARQANRQEIAAELARHFATRP